MLVLAALASLVSLCLRLLLLGPTISVPYIAWLAGSLMFVALVMWLVGWKAFSIPCLVAAAALWCLRVHVLAHHVAPWVVPIALACAGILFAISAEFSNTMLRIAASVVVVLTGALTVKAGRDNTFHLAQADRGRLAAQFNEAKAQTSLQTIQATRDTVDASKALSIAIAWATPGVVTTLATEIHQTLTTPLTPDTAEDAGAMLADMKFEAAVARSATATTNVPSSDQALIDLAATAVQAAQRATATDTATAMGLATIVNNDLSGLSAVSTAPDTAGRCTVSPTQGTREVEDLGVAEARTTRDIAAWRYSITGQSADQTALTQAQTAYTAASNRPCGSDTNLVAVFQQGGDTVAATIPGLQDNRIPLVLGIAGWILIGLGAIVGYRRLEIRSARAQIGPVSIGPVTGALTDARGDDGGATYCQEAIQNLVRMCILLNLPEPGVAPGANALNPMTDLLSAAGGLPSPSGPIVQAVVAGYGLMTGILFPKSGYSVSIELVSQATGTPAPANVPAASGGAAGASDATSAAAPAKVTTSALIEITDTRTGAFLHSRATRAGSEERVLRQASYQAAAWILDKSRVTPDWALWSLESATALGTYFAASDGATIAELVDALNHAPRSGLLCTLVGTLYDLDGKRAQALELYLRAATLYPLFYNARYRLSISFGMISEHADRDWIPLDPSARARIVDAYQAFRAARGGQLLPSCRVDNLCAVGDLESVKRELATVALDEMGKMCAFGHFPRLATLALRRSQRRFWLVFATLGATGRDNRRRVRDGLAACNLIAELRCLRWSGHQYCSELGALDVRAQKLEKAAASTRSWWPVAYNLACYQSIRSMTLVGSEAQDRRDEAVRLLEQAIVRQGSQQLTRDWVSMDPDLEPLKNETRFRQLVKTLV